jgi:hypothetical protein
MWLGANAFDTFDIPHPINRDSGWQPFLGFRIGSYQCFTKIQIF